MHISHRWRRREKQINKIMYIKKLQGSFGCLENKTLELAPGLNVITAPNESGKSTWSAFIRAMLYGISTRERARAGHLPDKERYRPGSGSAMYGRMELVRNGEEIEIERTSERDVFSKCVVRNLSSGTVSSEAGEALCGISRSVYERTAFIGQANIGVGADRDIERLILSVASSGEEGVAAQEVFARLEKGKRSIRSPRGMGSLADIEREIESKRSVATCPELAPIYDELRALELEAARAEAAASGARLEELAAERDIMGFPAFEGMSDSRAKAEAERDIKRIEERKKKAFSYIPLLLLILACVFTALSVLSDIRFAIGAVACAAFAAVVSAVVFACRVRAKKKLSRELMLRYGADTAEGIAERQQAYSEAFARLENAEKKTEAAMSLAKRMKRELERKREEFIPVKAAAEEKRKEETERLCIRRDELMLEYEAYELALETMNEANEILRGRFSPMLSQRTGEIFRELTGGSFELVRIKNSDFEMDVSKNSAAPPQNMLSLSGGTLDELYLALRLAMCSLLPVGDMPPVVLDDAFVNFDDRRLRRALGLLCEMAKERQIIIFSCHRREAEYLEGSADVNIITAL